MERRKSALPPGMETGPIEVTASYDSPTSIPDENGIGNLSMTYSGAAHGCFVEIDPGTGKVTILGYLMAEDSGVAINPLIVEGQHQGAVAMALGQVLYEGLAYDDNGQLLNGNYRDYYTPLATDIPDLSQVHDCGVPSKTTLLGQKGAGETGNVPPMAAVANAIEDATGIRFTEMPITPEKILLALRARAAAHKEEERHTSPSEEIHARV
jgi:carbon-monoxide dehydrogenase large subunit